MTAFPAWTPWCSRPSMPTVFRKGLNNCCRAVVGHSPAQTTPTRKSGASTANLGRTTNAVSTRCRSRKRWHGSPVTAGRLSLIPLTASFPLRSMPATPRDPHRRRQRSPMPRRITRRSRQAARPASVLLPMTPMPARSPMPIRPVSAPATARQVTAAVFRTAVTSPRPMRSC